MGDGRGAVMDRVFQSVSEYAIPLTYKKLPGKAIVARRRWVKASIKGEDWFQY